MLRKKKTNQQTTPKHQHYLVVPLKKRVQPTVSSPLLHLLLLPSFLWCQQPEAVLALEVNIQQPPAPEKQGRELEAVGCRTRRGEGILADLLLQVTIHFLPLLQFQALLCLEKKITTSIAGTWMSGAGKCRTVLKAQAELCSMPPCS